MLVNNLGWYPMEVCSTSPLSQWEQALTLNCTATFHLTQLALPLLEAATPPGRIINLGDSACDRLEAHVMATLYHIAKLGVHVLTRSYAQLLMPKGITVNMISPGFLENSVGRPTTATAGRASCFNDILGALDYLLSEQASYVSGTNLLVTGAWNLGVRIASTTAMQRPGGRDHTLWLSAHMERAEERYCTFFFLLENSSYLLFLWVASVRTLHGSFIFD